MIRLAASVVLVLAPAALAQPVITEVAWSGDPTSNSGTDEWIEIYNPDVQPVDLTGFLLIGAGTGSAALTLPAITINENDFVLVQNTAGVPSSDAARTVVTSSVSLTDSGEILCLCPPATAACDGTCDVVNPVAGAGWFAGSSTGGARKTMERTSPENDGSVAASWQDGAPASPGALAPEPVDAGVPLDDAGVPDEDAGNPVVDAGPNALPTLVVTEPAGTVSGASVNVVYSADDVDEGDEVTVELYWSLDESGQDGVLFAQGLPGGSGVSASFDTTGVPPGVVHVFGRARDTRGGEVYAYAPGLVEVAGGGPQEASFEISEPDGVNDGEDDGTFIVEWSVSLPAGQSGAVSLFVDDDDRGEDGEPLIGGLSAAPEGPRAFRWDPLLTGTPPGAAHVYGVLEHAGGRVVSYAPAAVDVPAEGCTCTNRGDTAQQSLPGALALAILLLRVARSRSARTRPSFGPR